MSAGVICKSVQVLARDSHLFYNCRHTHSSACPHWLTHAAGVKCPMRRRLSTVFGGVDVVCLLVTSA